MGEITTRRSGRADAQNRVEVNLGKRVAHEVRSLERGGRARMRNREHEHSGAMRRLDSRLGILDHKALRCLDRISLAEQKSDSSQRRDKQIWRGLLALRVLGAEHVDKQVTQMRAAQLILSHAPRSSGREHQRESLGAFAHELGSAGIHPIAVEQGAFEVENYCANHFS